MKTLLPFLSALMFAFVFSACSETASTTSHPTTTFSQPDYRQSKADYVVLNFFDMYCVHCQKDAKVVNELYERFKARKGGKKVDFYGIGCSNTPTEVGMYQKRFNVKYPLISDKDRAVSSRFGKVRTPLLIVLKKENGRWVEAFRMKRIKGKQDQIVAKINS